MVSEKKILLRVVDANFNRAKEALRTIEDILRFIYSDKALFKRIKTIRHKLTNILDKDFLKLAIKQRESRKDVGKKTEIMELKRKGINDVAFANFQRAKESLRVLEEIFKVIAKEKVEKFKNLRYKIYTLEKLYADKTKK